MMDTRICRLWIRICKTTSPIHVSVVATLAFEDISKYIMEMTH